MVVKDPNTGLPTLPEGQWWKITDMSNKNDRQSRRLDVNIMGTRTGSKKVRRFFFFTGTVSVPNEEYIIDSKAIYSYEWEYKDAQLEKCVRRAAWVLAMDRNRSNSYREKLDSFLGDYPPKVFPDSRKQKNNVTAGGE